jgi:nucleoside-diphosphate kinase
MRSYLGKGAKVPQLLAFLKPDAVLRKNVGATIVKELAENEDLEIQSFEKRNVGEKLAAVHYAHVADRPFYPWLERYVTGCPVYVMLIEVEDEGAVERLREFLGHTMSHKAEEGTIRGRFGIYAGVNCVHLSDSIESGERETSLWKEQLDIQAGRFDMSVEDFVARFDEALPDHTKPLRSLCIDVVAEGAVKEDRIAEVFEFLYEECPSASEEQLEMLVETVIGSSLS